MTATGRRLVAMGILALCTFLPRSSGAQIYPPAPGVPLPESYLEKIREDRRAYQFRHAWFRETARVRENRHSLEMDAGVHQAVWDGRDDRGAPVASGIYLLSLEVAGRSDVRKVSVVR